MNNNILDFCKDVKNALMEQDRFMFQKMTHEKVSIFYESDWRGLGFFSITEPILKYIIVSKLTDKYLMWSEYKYKKSKKLLDLALLLDEQGCKSEYAEPDTAIEMKWGAVTKNGILKEHSVDTLINDFIKMKKCDIKNKYLMQFFITDLDINGEIVRKELISWIDKRSFKSNYQVIFNESFVTDAGTEKTNSKFHIIVWEICA